MKKENYENNRFAGKTAKCSHMQVFSGKYRSKAKMIFPKTAKAALTLPVEPTDDIVNL